MYQFLDVNHAYVELAHMLRHAPVNPSRIGDTKEIHPLAFQIRDFKNYFLFNEQRVINFPMALAELVWIMIGSDEYWITKYNKQLEEYADTDPASGLKFFNAAYGHRMISNFGVNQLHDVINDLALTKHSRQAVMVYRDPVKDGFGKLSKDRACNVSSMFLIRDNKLDIVQTVRSQDFIWGLPYNLIQFGYITQYIAEQLGVEVGSYSEMVNSLHVYEQHWEDLERIAASKSEFNYDFRVAKLNLTSHMHIREYMRQMELKFTQTGSLQALRYEDIHDYSPFWYDALHVFQAYWLNKRGNVDGAMEHITKCKNLLFRSLAFCYFRKYYGQFRKQFDDRYDLMDITID